jgi:hypothetical protein
MYKGLGLFLTVTVAMMMVLGAPKFAGALSDLDLFRVVETTVEGAELLTHDEVRAAAAIPSGASVWDDLEAPAARLEAHPLILGARVRRRLPRGLLLEIRERAPVALLPSPTLTPVDRDARPIPVSPAGRRMDLPIIQPRSEASGEDRALTPTQLQALTSELERLGASDPAVLASVSEILMDSWGAVLLHLEQPRVALRYHPPLFPERLEEGLRALEDALEREPGRELVSVDLRFTDQVVVGFSSSSRP